MSGRAGVSSKAWVTTGLSFRPVARLPSTAITRTPPAAPSGRRRPGGEPGTDGSVELFGVNPLQYPADRGLARRARRPRPSRTRTVGKQSCSRGCRVERLLHPHRRVTPRHVGSSAGNFESNGRRRSCGGWTDSPAREKQRSFQAASCHPDGVNGIVPGIPIPSVLFTIAVLMPGGIACLCPKLVPRAS